jgi:predicted transcriptional regulator
MKRHRADEMRAELDVDIPDEKPYGDGDLLETLYIDEQMSTLEIGAVLDCSSATVNKYLDENGIEKRSRSEAVSVASGGAKDWYFYSNKVYGHETIKPNRNEMVLHHRLLAVAKFGFDAVKDKHVHHENGIPWDNRPNNLQLVTNSEHRRIHEGKYTDSDEIRAIDMYRDGASSYKVADEIGCAPATVRHWINNRAPEIMRNRGNGSHA